MQYGFTELDIRTAIKNDNKETLVQFTKNYTNIILSKKRFNNISDIDRDDIIMFSCENVLKYYKHCPLDRVINTIAYLSTVIRSGIAKSLQTIKIEN